jgi:amino acid transporter
MLLITFLNVLKSEIQAIFNNISVWWHVGGSVAIIAILWLTTDAKQDTAWVFTHRINNSGFGGETMYWLYVLPLGFLLTQYTITGYDASAHLAEESHGADLTAANGIWKSIFYSSIGGYILLLSILYVSNNPEAVSSFDPAVNPFGAGSAIAILSFALDPLFFKIVLVISGAGQLFCATACLTSCSRMMYAFSRDGLVPGSGWWSSVNHNQVPVRAVLFSSVLGIIMTLPALWKSPRGIPSAFYAVVSIGVIGLYLAFIIPIWLRWKAGDGFKAGTWNLGRNYRWMNPVAIAEIVIISVYFILPFEPAGVPGDAGFSWVAVNYAPILVGITCLLLLVWWKLSVKNWYNGPRRNI